MSNTTRYLIIGFFTLLAAGSVYFAFQLKFAFDFEQFFPQGDQDLEFFREFVEEFEGDDNFMLVAVERKAGVFEQKFLEDFHDFSIRTKSLPYVEESQSLTKFSYPVRTPFGITSIPAIHIDQPELYESDKEKILQDERFVYNLISPDATTLLVFMKNINSISLDQSKELMAELNKMIGEYDFDGYYYLGRPYFQKELVEMQQREIIMSAVVSGILVMLVMFWIFRRPIGIIVALISVGLGMLLFIGFLGATGRELNAIAALYPVLMIIVGTSDVIHIMSKYVDELKKGYSKNEAIKIAIKEIGLATLLTSVTTAIGFASLMTSRIQPIRDFGLNAAVGVLIAYVTVILFTTAVLSFYDKEKIIKLGRGDAFWHNSMKRFYQFTKDHPRRIAVGGMVVLGLCLLGMSMITTNYKIIRNMPKGKKITEDFLFFEEKFAGFRPLEFAVFAGDDYKANDFAVVREIDKVEDYLRDLGPVRAINSITTVYKSINQMYNRNKQEAYNLPEKEQEFVRYRRMIEKIPKMSVNVLISEDEKKARITSRILDVGADSIKVMGTQIDNWISQNVDPEVASFRRTGTGLIIDKNSEYVRRSLLSGLGMAILIVSMLMALLYRNIRMLVISLVPNIFPLLIAGAMLGFFGIELEAGVSIVFAVIFGIAVDDTIHFLSKYKLAINKGYNTEEALLITFTETGKAIVLTSIILFFGFLVMLFSIHPPSVTIGMLISMTLLSALLGDLLFIPVLIRWLMKKKEERPAKILQPSSGI
jgi:predicted RND superfamily exporter protein